MLTAKQEKFAQFLFQGMTQREAWGKAGYSTAYAIDKVDQNACTVANSRKVKGRLAELRNCAAREAIMSVDERKARLSEIAGARLTDYVTPEGVKVDSKSPNTAALAGLKARVRYSKKGYEPETITEVKLHDPVRAIEELNKMERVYEAASISVNVDNRRIEIIVQDEETRMMLEQARLGQGTK